MPIIRSLLWIGSSEGLGLDRVADSPTLDVTWVRDLDEALALPPARFDAALFEVDDADAALRDLRRLHRHPQFPPALVRLRLADGVRPTLPAGPLIEAGAADVLVASTRGDDGGELIDRIERMVGARLDSGGRPLEPVQNRFPGLLAHSPAMTRVLTLVERAANSQATVLLTGETGTGKEVIARALHQAGSRGAHAFVAVNCAAFPDTLLESELFGHVKGSFTGDDR